MFKTAIVSKVGRNFADGLSGKFGDLGKPELEKAQKQHADYIDALKECGLDVVVLEADEKHPDSTFVEDVAVVTEKCAVITNPAPESRKQETERMKEVLKPFFPSIEYIEAPGTVEGGDILQIENDFYVGISERTNRQGAEQFKAIMNTYGYEVTLIPVSHSFHLKGLVSSLGNGYITITGELENHEAFNKYHKIVVDMDEAYACNVIGIHNVVLMPKGYEKTKRKIAEAGFQMIELDMSEFQKQDGSLTCLSLRF